MRIEELVNYFRYDYPQPEGDEPFAVTTEVAELPVGRRSIGWCASASKGARSPPTSGRRRNLVFLIDVSGSMERAEQAAAGASSR